MGGRSCCYGHLERRHSQESLSDAADEDVKKDWPLSKKILIWSSVSLFGLILIAFLLIWVAIPVAFKLSIAFQRFMIFMPYDSPKNPNFANPKAYNIDGAFNFYISVTDNDDNKTITQIGAWLILPEKHKHSNTTQNISEILENSDHDLAVYFHGVYANRAKPIYQYEVIRKHFMILAIDHRGYGDSGVNVEMTEAGMINDHLQIYDWIASHKFKKNIYYWGHSLGCAIVCHTVRDLYEKRNVVPTGVILESAYTTLAEEVINVIIGKVFKWLPYFNSTILNPLENNGFHFRSTTNILSINCPIMSMHAKDDKVIPWFLGAKLADIAEKERDVTKQGSVTFHLFPAEKGYGHNDITHDPNIPSYVTEFKRTCEDFKSLA